MARQATFKPLVTAHTRSAILISGFRFQDSLAAGIPVGTPPDRFCGDLMSTVDGRERRWAHQYRQMPLLVWRTKCFKRRGIRTSLPRRPHADAHQRRCKLTDIEDPPDGWEKGAKLRRLLRETAVENDDHRPDDASEIFSSLKHVIDEIDGVAGTPLVKTVVEERGIRRSRRPVWSGPGDADLEDIFSQWGPDDTRAALFLAANRHLRAKGELDFFGVVQKADEIAEHSGQEAADPDKVTRDFELYVDELEGRKGSLSIETAAAKFVRAHDRLFMLLNENPDVQAAANAYADAWHWLHMEWSGEHQLAALGQSAEKGLQGLQAGPDAARQKAARRRDIIEIEYGKFAENEPNAGRRTSSKSAAPAMLAAVKAEFWRSSLGEIKKSTLERQLREVIKLRT